MQLYEQELEQALAHNDSAVAWRCCRTIACAVKGSRRKFQNAPRSHPSKSEFLEKYQKGAVLGGWGADVIGIDQIAKMESDFSDIVCDPTDMNVTRMFNGFARSCHYSKNRKACLPGDVPSEIWRIVLNANWILPTIRIKWGLGHEGMYQKPNAFCRAFQKLLAVVYNTKCLPIQAVCNVGACIPKKVMSRINVETAIEGMRTIHVYSAFTQNVLKYSQRFWNMRETQNHTALGAVKNRRREEAVAIQLHNHEFCKKMGWSVLTRFF